MKGLKTVLRLLALLLAGAVAGLGLYSWNARSLAGDAVPMPFGYGASVVLSGSMEPTLSVGDLLIVVRTEDYREQDIVVYQRGSMAVVHRIVELEGDSVITKGDANNTPDAPLPLGALKGRVIRVIPGVGRLLWAVRSPAGILVVLGLAVALTEASYRSEKKQKQQQNERIKAEIRLLMRQLQEENEE